MSFSLDSSLFQWFNGLSVTNDGWNPFMIFFADKVVFVMVLVLCIYWLKGKDKSKKMVLQGVLSTGIALGSGLLISLFVTRDRPFVSLAANKLIEHAPDNSFPSDHTMFVFALAGTILLHRKWEGVLWIAAAGLVAVARVWCGVHYPGDILFGAMIGFASALVVKIYLPSWSIVGVCLTYILRLYNYAENKTLVYAKSKKKKR